MSGLTITDLFSGAGGSGLGAHAAGFDLVMAANQQDHGKIEARPPVVEHRRPLTHSSDLSREGLAMQATRESYMPVPGFAGYLASRDGNIIGRRGRLISAHTIAGGYRRTSMLGTDGIRVKPLVHVVIAATFIGPRPLGMQVNHIDGDKTNNCADNLEYVTPSGNSRHSIDVLHTTRAPGDLNANAVLTAADVRAMRRLHAEGISAAEVGRRFGIDVSHAWRVVTRRAWSHLS